METFDPYHDEEARGVLFQVLVQGRSAQGYISCALLAQLDGAEPDPDAWVALYLRHRSLIDAVVARRIVDEAWDTVLVRRSDLPVQA